MIPPKSWNVYRSCNKSQIYEFGIVLCFYKPTVNRLYRALIYYHLY